jgi:hypothetical protein
VAWLERSEEDEPSMPLGRTRAPRTREASPPPLQKSPRDSRKDINDQLEGGIDVCDEESDSPIVVRDGKTDHMAKEWAERQSEQSTHRGRRMLPVPVPSTLLAIEAWIWFIGPDAKPTARHSEEPCAGKPHAGICEGGAR